jgi:exopolysaccharide biosynthesis protein
VFLAILFLLYGPYKGLSDLLILTSMHTSEHQYIAKFFYTDEYIKEVLEKNKVSPTELKTDIEGKVIKTSDNITVIDIKGNSFVGYLIKIDNPERLSLVSASNHEGQMLEDIVKENNALGGINASGYKDLVFQGIAEGISIINGETITTCDDEKHLVAGINNNNKLLVGNFTASEIEERNFKWAAECGPVLIVNGEKTKMTATAGGIAPRTAIGQTKEGSILLLVIDGRQISSVGASLYDVQSVLYEHGAVDAMNLDGGSSTSMYYNGKLMNSPSKGDEHRNLPNAIIFK